MFSTDEGIIEGTTTPGNLLSASGEPEEPSLEEEKIPELNNDELDLFHSFTHDYFKLYRKSRRDDFADFRRAVAFEWHTMYMARTSYKDFVVQCRFDSSNCRSTYDHTYIDPTYGYCFTIIPNRLVQRGNIN